MNVGRKPSAGFACAARTAVAGACANVPRA